MSRRIAPPLPIAGFAVGVVLFWAALYVYVPTLPLHAQSLGAGATMIGLIAGSYGFTQLILRIPLGVLSDRLSRRKAFVLLGFVATGVSSAVLALAAGPTYMLVGRALAGVAACAWVPCTVLFCSFFPPSQAVRATAIMSFSASFGQMIATLSGGYIARGFGTAAPFWVALAIAGLGLVVMSPTREEKRPAASSAPSFRAILGVLTLPALLSVSLVAAITQYAAITTSHAFVSVYATEVLKLDPSALGILSFAALVPNTVMAATVATMATRVREKWLLTAGLLLLAASTAAIPLTGSYAALVGARVVFGFGVGLTYPVLMGLSVMSVPQAQRASAMGAFQAIYALGMTAGPALSGFIKDSLGLPAVFYATGAMCLLGLLPMWAGVRAGDRKRENPAHS